MLSSSSHVSAFTRRRATAICRLRDLFPNDFHSSRLKGSLFNLPFVCVVELMLFVYSSKMSVTNHDKTSEPSVGNRMSPIGFARGPASAPKLKFLDFSPNKTRVIADVGGGLLQTQVTLSSMTTNSDFKDDYGDPHYTLTDCDSRSGEASVKAFALTDAAAVV